MKLTTILASLLIVSVIANIAFLVAYVPIQQDTVSQLVNETNALGFENMQLHRQLDEENRTLGEYETQLSFYRLKPDLSGTTNSTGATYITGYASVQAPAVSNQIVRQNTRGFITQTVIQNGTMMNISVEIRPGEGRVLVHTVPLMGIVFQDAANTAVYVAQKRTGENLSGSDVVFSIEAEQQLSAVDGPSAGVLMTLATIAALKNQPVNQDLTLTGTIDKDGNVGAIGGIVEKATAAKNAGKTLFLLPRGNSRLVQYTERTRQIGAVQYIEQVQQQVDTKEYLEENVGIQVSYVDTIDDVLAAALAK